MTPRITPKPDDTPPSASISWPTGTVRAGKPVTITVNANPGTGWTWKTNHWEPVPLVTFSETLLVIPTVVNLRDHRGGGTSYSAKFPNSGSFVITATLVQSNGTQIQAPSRTITVSAPVAPVFTWAAPAAGAALDLGPGGGQAEVKLTAGSDEFYPFTVSITHDGLPATQDQFAAGTQFQKTVAFGPATAGPRTISVTCADPNGLSSTQTRTLAARDSAPPTVALAPFSDRQTVRSLPHTVTLTGTTNGAQSGITGVTFAFTDGPSGSAQDTSSGGDWSAWRVQAPLAATGTYPFKITVTNSRGSSATASGTVTLVAQGPPVFTWAAPADGGAIDLGPAGGQVEVRLTSGSDQFYPFTVSITHDGLPATTDQYTGTQFQKTVPFGPAPLGARAITVTCADPNGLSSTQTRSLVGRDSVPPTVALAPFEGSQTVDSLPHTVTLTGTANGVQSGITGIAYEFTNGPSGSAQDTSSGGDWSAWQVQAPLATTGTYPFKITAVNSRGTTVFASGTITLHL
ncbi:hypothetical protein [Streptomyces sp. AK08-02]|uniref:hypothetical protein n=1 Tax=Streptomyces sp. AK08-02 TaxID=3028654 RepID=UPI0029A27F50|nr:hypothetical protein [Streptomyces sp. AK08-02]MDX3748945.1 hypothetical protein [Streptomyces sp. AK08-02]